MSRETSWFGLSERAREIVKGEQMLAYTSHETRLYPDGSVIQMPPREVFVSSVKSEPSGEHALGMFDEEIALSKYTMPDGKVYFERVQCDPWSSGPNIFTALQDESGCWIEQSRWTDEEICFAIGCPGCKSCEEARQKLAEQQKLWEEAHPDELNSDDFGCHA